MPLSLQPQKEKESNKESDQEKTKNQLRKPLLSTMKLCLEQKKFSNIERETERWSPWSSGSPFLRTNQRGNRNTIFWIDVSLIIIFNHRNNYIFFTLPCCLAYISWFSLTHELSSVIPKIFLSMNFCTPSLRFSSLSIIVL